MGSLLFGVGDEFCSYLFSIYCDVMMAGFWNTWHTIRWRVESTSTWYTGLSLSSSQILILKLKTQKCRILTSYLRRLNTTKTYDFSSSSFRMLTLLREPGILSRKCSFWLKMLLLHGSSTFIQGQERCTCKSVLKAFVILDVESRFHLIQWATFSLLCFIFIRSVSCFKKSYI